MIKISQPEEDLAVFLTLSQHILDRFDFHPVS